MYDRYGFVHLREEAHIALVVVDIGIFEFWNVWCAWVVFVNFHGKCGKWYHVDAIAVLEGVEVGITEREADDGGNTGFVASSGTHPHEVVVAPLDVHIVILTDLVEDEMRTWSAVVDVAYEVKAVDD